MKNYGTLYVVATPIGNLNDLSNRAIDTLKNSDLILAEDTRQTIKLLNHFDIKTKMASYHKFNETKKAMETIDYLKEGKNISLVSDAGTPCISDPGYIIVKKCREEKINVIGIPGCSAIIDALSIGGLDTSSFSFYGFVPTENKLKKQLFEEIKNSNIKTKVVYESPKRIVKLLNDLKNEIPDCMVSLCGELTKIHERCIYGKIDEVYEIINNNEEYQKGEYVVLISNEVKEEKSDDTISLEAMIIDTMIKENCSIKDAVNILNKKCENISKKDIYNASLNLKKITNV